MNVATEEHNIKEDDTLIVRDRHGPLATLRPFQRRKLSEVGLSEARARGRSPIAK